MFDPEKEAETKQLIKEYRRVIAFLEAHEAELVAKGLDVQARLVEEKAALADFEKICSATEEAEQGYLQATADLADKEREVFKETSKMVDHLLDANPDDPRVQELLQKREELKKLFPKE